METTREKRRLLTSGYKLARPEKGDEVVITGMAGRFPDSDDIYEFRDNLYNKVDLVSGDNRRWEPIMAEIPQRTGKINFLNKFDAGFFGIHERQAHSMDPMCRMLIERSYEAIMDAGVNPHELKGTRTGVFVGACFSETEKSSFYDMLHHQAFGITGASRSMLAQRISYFLKLEGPSFVTDTACSSSMFALEEAYKSIRNGKCDAALVGGTNLCLHPMVSLQFARLGVLSPDGSCKSFDNSANGYVRSEAVAVVFLQRAKDARRIYAQVLHCKTNCDGFKEQGITYPSGNVQKLLLEEFYQDCKIDPNSVHYVEAHGTGTKVGDPEELNTITEVFCTNRKNPLLIGSVKSNIGHNEPVSGVCSVVKVLLGMEHGYIPPNMHYNEPREGVEGLRNGCLKVVSEKTKWPPGEVIAGINSFGFGGGNGHALLKYNGKSKKNSKDNNTRLVCVSGRTHEAIEYLLKNLAEDVQDIEYIRLIHEIFGTNIPNHPYRGFLLLSPTGPLKISVKFYDGTLNPLYIICAGLEKQWPKIGKDLLAYPLFSATIQRIHNINKHLDLSIIDVILNYNPENIIHQFVATVSIQIALFEILKQISIVPEKILGYSIGELSAAYFDGILTLEQAISIAYYTAKMLQKDVVGTQLQSCIKNVIPSPIKLGYKWVPSVSNYVKNGTVGSEYFSLGLLNQLLLNEAKIAIPKDAIILEIGTLNTIPLTSEERSLNIIDLVPKDQPNLVGIFRSLGRLFEQGLNPKLASLYPTINWPVSRGTRSVSPYIKWNHAKDMFVTIYRVQEKIKCGYRIVELGLRDDDWTFISGHTIDGRVLFPATGYLHIIWETFAMMVGKLFLDMRVLFTNVKFIRASTVTARTRLELTVCIHKYSGLFEISEGGATIVTGKIEDICDSSGDWAPLPIPFIEDEEIMLNQSDIYKELRLRGYNYTGSFRALKQVNLSANHGLLHWSGNWITFMDNMLQMQILRQDTRFLYVPTSIEQLSIDGKSHMKLVNQLEGDQLMPIYTYGDLNLIRSGAIEIRGINASSIVRRKQAEPVLETYKFVPNIARLNVNQSIGVVVQVALENHGTTNPKVVEVLSGSEDPLIPLIQNMFENLPVIQADLTVITDRKLELEAIKVEDKKLSTEKDVFMVVGVKLMEKPERFNEVIQSLKPNGFLLSRELLNGDLCEVKNNVQIICDHSTESERLLLLQKIVAPQNSFIINISNNEQDFAWLETFQKAVKTNVSVILVAQDCPHSGILGLINCVRREPSGDKVRAVFIMDQNMPPFDQKLPFYKQQLEKGLAINVFNQSRWGTYRHLLLTENSMVKVDHAYVNAIVRGDLSSLSWVQGQLNTKMEIEPNRTLLHIYSAAVNFRDIMTASGKISVDYVTRNRLEQECIQGFEFSGRDNKGNRWMGMLKSGSMATLINAETILLFRIPDAWSLEEAATVPVVYGTVLYAFFMRADLKSGQSVLIHSGTGGVGQAAINVALNLGCTVFTTVGTEDKRAFIREHYPQIRPQHIGCSRDTSFEQMVLQQTKGRGVDLVLNSLAEEKLQASIRCLARGGSFVEIGKFDLAANNPLYMELFERDATFYGFMLDAIFDMDYYTKAKLVDFISQGIRNGSVRPLPRTCFRKEEIEQAFRYMATGKHIGKVLIRIRKEEPSKVCLPTVEKFDAIPRFYCNPLKSYIILGGLGGFGMELADLFVLRGARNLVLTTRNGIKTGYQAMRIRTWKSYGVNITIVKNDATTREKCEQIICEAKALGDVAAVFNLAVVLRDALIENQTIDNYQVSFAAKADSTIHLDQVTREHCPNLEYFVVFSSVSCGRGNAGQTNYGMANSVMERVCEQRVQIGLPGLAVQWGAIGDVGLVAELQEEHVDLVIGGTLQQRITSCLEVLDRFLRQPDPVVASMVVAEKKIGTAGAGNMVDAVVNIMGLRDLKTVSLHSTLPELGMDSMMAVEIKQTLEREYEVFLTAPDIRSMTFARLQEISLEKSSHALPIVAKINQGQEQIIFSLIASEELSNIPIVRLKTVSSKDAKKIFLFPGLEGNSVVFDNLAKRLNANVICFQYAKHLKETTIREIAESMYPSLVDLIEEDRTFNIIAHSFGSVVALELVSMLEQNGYNSGNLILLDGGLELMQKLVQTQFKTETEELFQTSLLTVILSTFISGDILGTLEVELLKCGSYNERIHLAHSKSPIKVPHTLEYIEVLCISAYNRIKAIANFKTPQNWIKVQSRVRLYRPTIMVVADVSEDHRVSEVCEQPVEVCFFEGNHLTLIDNPEMVQEINKVLNLTAEDKVSKKFGLEEDEGPITKMVIRK